MQSVVFAIFAILLLFSGYRYSSSQIVFLQGRKIFVESYTDFQHLLGEDPDVCKNVSSFRVNLLGVYRSFEIMVIQLYGNNLPASNFSISLDGKNWKNLPSEEETIRFSNVSKSEHVRWVEVIIPKGLRTCVFRIFGETVQDDFDLVPRSDIVGSKLTALFDGDKDKPANIQWSSSSPIEIALNRTYFITLMRIYVEGTSDDGQLRDVKITYKSRHGTKLFGTHNVFDKGKRVLDFGGFLNNKMDPINKFLVKINISNFMVKVREIQLFGAPYLAWQWETFVATGDGQELVREKNDSIDECFIQCMGFKHFAIINGSTCQCQEDTHVPQQHTKSTVVFSPPEIIGCLPPDRINIYIKRKMQLGRSDTTHTCFTYCSDYRFVGIQENRVCLCLDVEEHQLETIKEDCGIVCELHKEMLCLSNTGTNVIKITGMKLETMQNSADQHEVKMSYWKFMAILVGSIIAGCVVLFFAAVFVAVYFKKMHEKRNKYGVVPSVTTSSSISELQCRSAPQKPKQPGPDEPYLPYRIVPLPRHNRVKKTAEPSRSSDQDEMHDN